MTKITKLFFITIFFLGYSLNSNADALYFIDFAKVLNQSKSGSEAQLKLKNKFTRETKKFQKIEESIKKDESELILQKKIISAEDYKKKVATLRKKVSDLQKNRQKSFSSIAKSRDLAKQNLLKAVNPIIKKYMTDNKIRIILNKKEVIMGDTSLEITSQIITILNKEFPAIKIN